MALKITKDTKGIVLRTQDSEELLLTNDTVIGSHLFANRTDLLEVVIPEGITFIEENAFIGCTNLRSVILPESITDIDCWGERRVWKISLVKPFINLPGYLRGGMPAELLHK